MKYLDEYAMRKLARSGRRSAAQRHPAVDPSLSVLRADHTLFTYFLAPFLSLCISLVPLPLLSLLRPPLLRRLSRAHSLFLPARRHLLLVRPKCFACRARAATCSAHSQGCDVRVPPFYSPSTASNLAATHPDPRWSSSPSLRDTCAAQRHGRRCVNHPAADDHFRCAVSSRAGCRGDDRHPVSLRNRLQAFWVQVTSAR